MGKEEPVLSGCSLEKGEEVARAVKLADVVITERLAERRTREPDYAAENRALVRLAETMARRPEELFQTLADVARELTGAGSAGISLLDPAANPPVFRWRAASGLLGPLVGAELPRHFSPCGVVLDRNATQVMSEPARFYPYLAEMKDQIREGLLVPFRSEGIPIGTVWLTSHEEGKVFDAEDARVAASLSHFAAAAWAAMRTREEAGAARAALESREKERVKSEQELMTAQRRIDAALIAGEVGVYEWKVKEDRLYGDRNLTKLFGLSVDENGAAPLSMYLEAIHPADRASTAERIQRSLETGENFEADYRVRTPKGERWVNSRGRMLKDEDGSVVSFFGVVLDVTARKQAEEERERIAEELRRLSATYETVLSATDDFAYIFDRQGRFLYANRRLLKVWAKTLEEVVGKTCYDLGYPTWHADMHMREIEQVIATGQPIRGEVPFTGGSGISGIYDYIFTPVMGRDGTVELIAGTTREVTERKRAERELARLHEEAVRASKAKDDFLATLSHELRTPLNPVMLIASEGEKDPMLPEAARSAFEAIRRNVELEARLIDDLLDLTTITRGKLAVRKRGLDFHRAVRQAVDSLAAEFAAKQIDPALDLRAERVAVEADPDRLQQVLLNLIRNAVKFTPAGGSVGLRTVNLAPDAIELRVVDSGLGMTKAELERVFLAFEQGDHAVAFSGPRFGGLGLGLAIAKQLVELHGGTVTATSDGRGCGSTFVVRLPLSAAAEEPEIEAAYKDGRGRGQGRQLQPMRVLLVEDHEPTRAALSQLLQRRGHWVTPADSVAVARRRATEATFDVLISDLGLPDGDGTVLMRELRQQYGMMGVALTGYGMSQDIERTTAAGFEAHLTKPVRMDALDAVLAVVVRGGRTPPLAGGENCR